MKVSVLMITHNHADFVEQAIDSALMQNFDGEFEIVVGDDCSTDGTVALLRRAEAKHAGKVRVLYHDQRVGMHVNARQTYELCTGEYIAVLEGDDFWTSPDKLRRQAALLDRHPDYVLCFHRAVYRDVQTGKDYDYGPADRRDYYVLEDILFENFIPQASILVRNHFLPEWPRWISELSVADWPLDILCAERGRLGYIDETMSVYRVHARGVWSSSTDAARLRTIVTMYQRLNEHFQFKYEPLLRALIRNAERTYGEKQQRREEHRLWDEERRSWTAERQQWDDERQSLLRYIERLEGEQRRLHERLTHVGGLAAERPELYTRIEALTAEVEARDRQIEALTAGDRRAQALRTTIPRTARAEDVEV